MIELEIKEAEALLNQLEGLPMVQVENMVGFFRMKLKEAEEKATKKLEPILETKKK